MLKNWKRNTFIFMGSQLISLFGSALVQYAITWHITLETGSGVYATIAVICGFLPTFILSPFAGVWADRYNRKTLIIIADVCIALTTLALAIAFMSGYDYIELLFVALAIRGLGTAVQTPCVSAILPDFVPTEHLTRVNGMNGSIQALNALLAPVLSGALLGVSSIEKIFMIDVITAVIAVIILTFFLKMPNKVVEKQPLTDSYFSQLKDGFAYIKSQHYLSALFIYCGILYIAVGPMFYLTPLLTVRVFGNEIWLLTTIEIASGVGMMIGSIIMVVWGGFKNKVVTMIMTMAIIGISITMLGFPSYFWVYCCLLGIICIMLSMSNTAATVLLQTKVAPEYIGRSFGVLTMLSSSLMPLGMLIWGPMSDVIPIENVFIITGLIIFALAVAVFFTPSLRKVGKE